MTAIISSVTADALAAAETMLQQPSAWVTSASGFAYKIFEDTGTVRPAFMTLPPPSTSAALLRRTPELAAYGYLINHCEENVLALWLAAIEHLRGREIYPADRQSFIFNPIEILGVATGLARAGNEANEHRGWFADTIRRGVALSQFRTPVSRLASNVALSLVTGIKSSEGSSSYLRLDDLTLPDLLLTVGIYLAFGQFADIEASELEKNFIEAILKEPLHLSDTSDAATIHIFCRRIVDHIVLGRSDIAADEKIVSLCRRFPLLVYALQNRQRQKPAFAVDDEYDVQDLLHGILRLHFNDVRPEEYTPSHAGKHSRVDFFLPTERIVVEAKMTRKSLGQKEVIDELSIDTVRYSKLKEVDTLICLIFDPQRFCTNPKAIETDVENSGGRLKVRVVVCPQGI